MTLWSPFYRPPSQEAGAHHDHRPEADASAQEIATLRSEVDLLRKQLADARKDAEAKQVATPPVSKEPLKNSESAAKSRQPAEAGTKT